jgi:CO/xanthine dehydrogenase FAD-binding subunit
VRAYLPAYELIVPKNLTEAWTLLEREPEVWKPFAGGTDLMVLLESGKLEHRKFFSIWNLPELKGIEVAEDRVTLGALTTYTEIRNHAILQREFPLLCQAAKETGGIATQNRGTLGGNIVNASPAADSPPALLVYDAELELMSFWGSRRLPYHRFHRGYKAIDLWPNELLRCIHLPRYGNHRHQYYRKVGARKAQAISKVCFAGSAEMDGATVHGIRIALGSVAPVVMRCVKTEAFLKGRKLDSDLIASAQAELGREIAPIDDIRSTARYRLRVAQNLLQEFLQTAIAAHVA